MCRGRHRRCSRCRYRAPIKQNTIKYLRKIKKRVRTEPKSGKDLKRLLTVVLLVSIMFTEIAASRQLTPRIRWLSIRALLQENPTWTGEDEIALDGSETFVLRRESAERPSAKRRALSRVLGVQAKDRTNVLVRGSGVVDRLKIRVYFFGGPIVRTWYRGVSVSIKTPEFKSKNIVMDRRT
jgi:hypothetical protein